MNSRLDCEKFAESIIEQYNVSRKAADYLAGIAANAVGKCIYTFGTKAIEKAVEGEESNE